VYTGEKSESETAVIRDFCLEYLCNSRNYSEIRQQQREGEKAEAFNAFFASVFNNTDRPWAVGSSESEHHECGNSDFPFMDTEIVRDQLCQLNVHKPMGLMGFIPGY